MAVGTGRQDSSETNNSYDYFVHQTHATIAKSGHKQLALSTILRDTLLKQNHFSFKSHTADLPLMWNSQENLEAGSPWRAKLQSISVRPKDWFSGRSTEKIY